MEENKAMKEKRERNGYIDIIKWIAIITMTIDHVGIFFFDNNELMRTIGRLAFPLFAYLIAVGLRNTRDRKKYILRMGIFAVISQYPYYLLFQDDALNVLFTFLIPMILIAAFEKKKIVISILMAVLIFVVPVSYGLYGIFITLAFYIFEKKKLISIITFVIVTAIYTILDAADFQIYAILSGIFIYINANIKEIKILKLHKYAFYIYYPLHIFIIWLLIL